MSPGTYTLDQIAVLFQRSASTLRGHLTTLTAEHGFPPPLPCFDNLWSKAAVDRWLETGGHDRDAAAVSPAPDSLSAKYGDAA